MSLANDDSFSSFPICIPFISFSSVFAVSGTSKTILKKPGKCGHPFLFPDLRGNVFSFLPLKMMFSVGLSWKWKSFSHVQLFCNHMDYSLSGSSFHGIFQARILEWIAISFSRGSSWPRDWTGVSCIAGRFYTISATREAIYSSIYLLISISEFIPPPPLPLWQLCLFSMSVDLFLKNKT